MLILNAPPNMSADALRAYYRRLHEDGLVFSSMVCRERYGVSESYDPLWGVDSIEWVVGGSESYEFVGGPRVTLKSGGVLAISRAARYAYEAHGESPFRSNMIVFSRALSDSVESAQYAEDLIGPQRPPEKCGALGLHTGHVQPSPTAARLMTEMTQACRACFNDVDWHEERATLLYAALFHQQQRRDDAAASLPAAKAATRRELARRAGLALSFMHESYDDSALTLDALAREARLSRFHFVRVFKSLYGETPMQYLNSVRMDAAARLLKETDCLPSAVASAVGHKDRTAFFRRFRRHYGVSPTAFRALL